MTQNLVNWNKSIRPSSWIPIPNKVFQSRRHCLWRRPLCAYNIIYMYDRRARVAPPSATPITYVYTLARATYNTSKPRTTDTRTHVHYTRAYIVYFYFTVILLLMRFYRRATRSVYMYFKEFESAVTFIQPGRVPVVSRVYFQLLYRFCNGRSLSLLIYRPFRHLCETPTFAHGYHQILTKSNTNIRGTQL